MKTQTRDSKSKKHNYPLGESLLFSFLAALGLGLSLHVLVKFIREHHLPLHRSHDLSTATSVNNSWEIVSYHGDITIHRRPVKNTQLYRYRYILETSVPRDELAKSINNQNWTAEWMPWLLENEEIVDKSTLTTGEQASIAAFRYILPYPGLHTRQIVAYHSTMSIRNAQNQDETVVSIRSVGDDDPKTQLKALCDGCKKATLDLNITLSTDPNHKRGKTQIKLELFMDPKASKLPSFMINAMNKKWGIAALHRLTRLSRRNLGWDIYTENQDSQPWYSWLVLKQSLYSMLPIKR